MKRAHPYLGRLQDKKSATNSSRILVLRKQAEHSFTCWSNYLIFVVDLAILLEAGLTLLLLRGSVLCHHNVVALFCKGTRFLFYGHKLYYARVRLFFETTVVSIQNIRNWTRNQFQHYPKQNVCFASIVLVFLLNLNLPKQTEKIVFVVS